MEHYYDKNNNAFILISPEYGSGWSTWNEDIDQETGEKYTIARDKRIVEKFLEQPHVTGREMEEFLKSLGYNVYMGGYDNLTIAKIPKGHQFIIDDYDGYEEIEDLTANPLPTA